MSAAPRHCRKLVRDDRPRALLRALRYRISRPLPTISAAVTSFESFASPRWVSYWRLNPSFQTFIQDVKDAALPWAVSDEGGVVDGLQAAGYVDTQDQYPDATGSDGAEFETGLVATEREHEWLCDEGRRSAFSDSVDRFDGGICATLTQPVSDLINKEIKKVQDTITKISTEMKGVDLASPRLCSMRALPRRLRLSKLIAA